MIRPDRISSSHSLLAKWRLTVSGPPFCLGVKLNIRRILPILLVAMLIGITSMYAPKPAHAAVNYTWSYDFTNVYNTNVITYSFSGLDSATTYRWDLFLVDPVTGQPTQSVGFQTFTGGTSDSPVYFGGVNFSTPAGTPNFPDGYVGPVAIVDSNGTVLGRHFVTTLPTYLTTTDSQWFDSGAGNTTIGERQVVGGLQDQGTCRNPVYNEFNSSGWLHDYTVCGVATVTNGYAILHYQVTAAYDPASDDDDIIFYRVPTSTVAISISVNALIDYQQTAAYTPGSIFYSFVVLNTSGRTLPFIDNNRASNAFGTVGNPMLGAFLPGIYNYSRYDSGSSWVSDGESVFVVTDDPSLNEWSVTAGTDQIAMGGYQVATTHAVTPEIWTSYHGQQVLSDGLVGTVDSTVYSFATARSFRYQTSTSALDDSVAITWDNIASSLNSGLATPAEMGFEAVTYYANVAAATFEQNLNTTLHDTGLDTPAGRAALFTIILTIGMIGVSAFPGLRNHVFAYLVMWTGLGGVFVLGGLSTLLITSVWGVMTFALWVGAVLLSTSNTNEDY